MHPLTSLPITRRLSPCPHLYFLPLPFSALPVCQPSVRKNNRRTTQRKCGHKLIGFAVLRGLKGKARQWHQAG
jgi:hypothetical protein